MCLSRWKPSPAGRDEPRWYDTSLRLLAVLSHARLSDHHNIIYHLSRPLFLDPNPGSNIENVRLIGLTRLKPYSEHNLVSFLADQTLRL